MAFDIGSFLVGGALSIVLIIVGLFALLMMLKGRAQEQIKAVLKRLYSTTSLMLIAIFDVAASFDPTQTLLGIGLAPLAGVAVFFSEWGLHDKFNLRRILPCLVEGFIAAIIIAIPTPIAGLFVAWFGVAGDKKKKA